MTPQTSPTPQTFFGENLLGGLMITAAAALSANEQTILTDLGGFTPKIESGMLTIEEDLENKLNPILKGIVTSGFAMLNPIIEGELPTGEQDGLAWLISELSAEGKKLQG
jgi:hypothetical protein